MTAPTKEQVEACMAEADRLCDIAGEQGASVDLRVERIATALAAKDAEIAELRATIAAERGDPAGAVSEGWAPTADHEWTRFSHYYGHVDVNRFVGGWKWGADQKRDLTDALYTTARECMLAADRALVSP